MKRKNRKNKMHVKLGDTVQIITGNQKGQVGQIKKIIQKKSRIILENLNLKTKHVKPQKEEESGQIINIEAAIHSSNVMLYSKKNKVRSRYRIKINESNKKFRILNKTQEIV